MVEIRRDVCYSEAQLGWNDIVHWFGDGMTVSTRLQVQASRSGPRLPTTLQDEEAPLESTTQRARKFRRRAEPDWNYPPPATPRPRTQTPPPPRNPPAHPPTPPPPPHPTSHPAPRCTRRPDRTSHRVLSTAPASPGAPGHPRFPRCNPTPRHQRVFSYRPSYRSAPSSPGSPALTPRSMEGTKTRGSWVIS